MAGSLQIVAFQSKPSPCSAPPTRGHWEVHFSRFLIHRTPPPSSTCPDLVPRRSSCTSGKTIRRIGTWLSSTSPASLQLIDCGSEGDAILAVYLGEKRMVQKFALRFGTNCEAEAFTNALIESMCNMNSAAEIDPPIPPLASEIVSHSEFVSSSTPPHRCQEEVDAAPAAKLEPEAQQCGNHQETLHNHNAEVSLAAYPPSFTTLLTSCQSEAGKVTAQPTSSKEERIRSQIMMYMEDSAFQDMLITVEKVIEELGGDLAL
ncbi:protein POOR HOMOLOGOUS SYNAPSIS 1 isoform X2 [Punica granatum]|uniref:Protein POOR HOMOLOGOUS SYNAPSIS 1 isoform X2 n=1 Tax=Punica granatum TaxID=22663 RepID=A0A6P8DWB5_PUNGR|nr:protein POOR HOMOLOGOUS SYNAPSIS 1 isoform X2 [Punica granatum]